MESKVDDLLSPVLNLLREQFEQLRSELLSELRQRRPSTSATASQLLGRSHDSSEFRPRDAPWPSEGRLLPSHKSFLSKKLLEEEREASRDERVYPMPLRALLGGAPKPPVVEERLRESACSSSSSSCSEAQVAPPSEPPAQLSSQLHTSSALTSAASERPKLQRKRTSMTEKAFSLTRGGSMTSLETFTTGWLQRLLVRLVSNIFFETLSMVMLCANAVVIGVQTDYMAVNNLLVIPWGLRFLDITFCVFFTLELALRIFAHRRRFFRMNGCAWNVMDLLLVSAHVGEEILLVITDLQNQAPAGSAASGRASNTNPDVMRVIRILRAIKVVRLIGAVRFTQDLQLLINCLFRSLKQFLWSALLLLMAIYVVAIYITQAATSYRIENEEALGGCASVESCRVMTKWWGSMPQSVLSLFQGVTGGVDWHAIADPLIDGISPWFGLLFIVFMAFCILALLNVITGTFVETMSQQAKELQLRNRIYQARRLFREIDIDGSGFISPDEILGQTDRPAVQEFFETIDVDPSDARGLVEVIDIDGNGKINFEEFLQGSLRLNGHAKSSDLIMLAREMKRFQANQIRDIAEIKADLKSALS